MKNSHLPLLRERPNGHSRNLNSTPSATDIDKKPLYFCRGKERPKIESLSVGHIPRFITQSYTSSFMKLVKNKAQNECNMNRNGKNKSPKVSRAYQI